MAYCTASDIKSRLGKKLSGLADSDADGTYDASVVEASIADADIEIDDILGARYTVPFTTTPDIIKLKSIDLTIYRLYRNRFDSEPPPTIPVIYSQAIAYLRKLAAGLISIQGVAPAKKNIDKMILTDQAATDQIYTDTILDDPYD